MRISDWSSDVCSSDLDQHGNTEPSDDLPPYTGYHKMPVQIMKHTHQPRRTWRLVKHLRIGGVQPQHRPHRATLGIGLSGLRGGYHHWFARLDRKRVV